MQDWVIINSLSWQLLKSSESVIETVNLRQVYGMGHVSSKPFFFLNPLENFLFYLKT